MKQIAVRSISALLIIFSLILGGCSSSDIRHVSLDAQHGLSEELDNSVRSLIISQNDEVLASCLATKIDTHAWLTAAHCIPNNAQEDFKVEIGLERVNFGSIFKAPENRDVAVFLTEREIPGVEIPLSFQEVTIGDTLTFSNNLGENEGYIEKLTVVDKLSVFTNGLTFSFENVLKSTATTESTTCHGDSGGPLLDGQGRIVAVHTAGAMANCSKDEGGATAYHSELVGLEAWILGHVSLNQ